MNKPKEAGFTLIELVIVITIVGILAAVALPRYVNMQSEARAAKAAAIFGAIRSASALAHSRCLLDLASTSGSPTCTTTGGTANMEGTAVTMVNQYPTADSAGIIAAAQVNGTSDGLTVSSGGSSAGSVLTIDVVGATTAANCRISYTAPTSGNSPTISSSYTGC